MTKSKGSAKVGGKGKASGVKISNKTHTKLAKRGQLDHQKKKKKEALKKKKEAQSIKAQQASQHVTHSIPEAVVEDEGYFEEANVGFAKSLLRDDDGKKKKKRKIEDNEVEALFSKKRSQQWIDEESTPLLPIKDKRKIIQRAQKIEQPESEEENDAEEGEVEEPIPKPLPEVSVVNLYALRAHKLQQRQTAIASMSCAVVENPEENMKKLRALREFWTEKDPDIRTASRKLLLMSLTEIFKDILPDYNIRVTTQTEKQQAVAKDTKQLRQFEENLLYNYKMYLQMLEECIGKSSDKKGRETATDHTKGFRLLAVKCMCQVFVRRPTFNFSKNIVNVLVPLMAVHNQEILDVICDTIKQIFKDDKKGETSLEIVRAICRTVKSKTFNVNPQVLDTFLALRIKEINTEEDRQKKMTHKEKMKQWSRKERKMDKKKKELNKQLEEAAVEVNRKKIMQTRTDTISAIFTLYFMILKKAQDSELLSPVLVGLAKFAHLINVDFFDDLFKVMRELLSLDILTLADVLHITKTAFTILSGQGEALNIDPQHFYTHLYKVLPQLSSGEGIEVVPHMTDLIKLMFYDRKKRISSSRVLAYTKRLVNIAIQLQSEPALILLTAAKTLFSTFPQTDILLDTECVGSGVYRPDLDEPEYCNPHNTHVLYELHLLMHHENEAVKQCAKLLLKTSAEHQAAANKRTKCMLCLQSAEELIDLIQHDSNLSMSQDVSVSKKKGKKQGDGKTNSHLHSMYASSG